MEKFEEKHYEQFKADKEAKDRAQVEISEEEKRIIEKIYAEAKMPTVMKDDDVQCGEGELDIRKLNRPNRDQMQFRAETLTLVYLRHLVSGIMDIEKLLMLNLKKQGVSDIGKALDELNEDLLNELKLKRN